MTNEELKKKIVKILEEGYTPVEYDDGDWVRTYFPTNEDVADALIAAGIGDVEEAEHRAEVAEQKATAWKDCANKWQKYYKEQAEREIKEEKGE